MLKTTYFGKIAFINRSATWPGKCVFYCKTFDRKPFNAHCFNLLKVSSVALAFQRDLGQGCFYR